MRTPFASLCAVPYRRLSPEFHIRPPPGAPSPREKVCACGANSSRNPNLFICAKAQKSRPFRGGFYNLSEKQVLQRDQCGIGSLPVIDHIVTAAIGKLLGELQQAVIIELALRAFDDAIAGGHSAMGVQVITVAAVEDPAGLADALFIEVIAAAILIVPADSTAAVSVEVVFPAADALPTRQQRAGRVEIALQATNGLPALYRLAVFLPEGDTTGLDPAFHSLTVFIIAP